MKYEEAIQELDAIVTRIENNQLDIDQLTAQLKRAKELIAFCKEILYKTDEEVKKLLEDA
jgi:exodeoxyribonuclease VII small subunit